MQGFNMGRYHPPDSLDKSLSSNNETKSKRRQVSKGPPTVRFEMPFAIWCTNCQPEEIIGQGVRFNAQKTRVGNYHTTPIWSFEMRHGPCGEMIEIRTDPAIGDYVVEKGGRRRDYGDAVSLSEIGVERQRKDGGDPFAGVEGRTEMGIKARSANQVIERLQDDNDRKWDDPFKVNQRLRKTFRVERKLLKEKEQEKEEIANRLALSVDILDNTEEDAKRAALVDFGSGKDGARDIITAFQSRPLFENPKATSRKPSASKEKNIGGYRQDLQRLIQQNSRASQDPFLVQAQKSSEPSTKITGLKRKRATEADNVVSSDTALEPEAENPRSISGGTSLVAYASDDSG